MRGRENLDLFLSGILVLERGSLSVGLAPLDVLIDGILKSKSRVLKRMPLKRDEVITVRNLSDEETVFFIKLKDADVSLVADHDFQISVT